MNILGIETSCDETSAAVVKDGREVLSNVVFSQVQLHEPYGGVVPEIASRAHVESLPGIIDKAVRDSSAGWDGIDGIAFTYGPGLASSLLVGISAAKALAIKLKKPLYPVNHLHAHIYSISLGEDSPRGDKLYPFIALMVSGGHTCLVKVNGIGSYTLMGQTLDDAAGEAFDKGANLLKLGYPGGPAIEKVSNGVEPASVKFPRGRPGKVNFERFGLNPDYCFSFSGLKTSLLYYLKKNPADNPEDIAAIASGYQEAIVDSLHDRCRRAMKEKIPLAVVGGVSLNRRLRYKLGKLAKRTGIPLYLADPAYCTDNAAMVAGLAGAGGSADTDDAYAVDACPNLEV